MLDFFYDKLQDSSGVAAIIISVAFMLFSGYAMTRITKKLHLPNVTAYIVAGILLGPYCFKIVPPALVEGMDFIADIALAFIYLCNRTDRSFTRRGRHGDLFGFATAARHVLCSHFIGLLHQPKLFLAVFPRLTLFLRLTLQLLNTPFQFQRFLIISFRSCFIKTTQLPVDVLVGIGGGTDRRTVIIRVFFRKEYSIRHRLFPFQ